MKPEIEKIFQVFFRREYYATRIRSIAVYHVSKKGGWRYCILTSPTVRDFPMNFQRKETLSLIQSDLVWHKNWIDLVDHLNKFYWQVGVDAWCHPWYADQIWRQYSFWQGLTQGFWLSVVRGNQIYLEKPNREEEVITRL